MIKADYLRSLARLCRRFGGRLALVSDAHYYRLFDGAKRRRKRVLCESPFTCGHGIHWQRKLIYAVRGHEEVGSIIHEMGHVFADLHHPESAKSKEWSWLGWEIAVARQIGAYRMWSRQNAKYNTGRGFLWGALSTQERRAVVVDRLACAQQIGVITHDGTPRSIR